IDYIIGDKTLFTLADAADYSERLVQLPDSFQPNDRKRQISTKAFTRQGAGLPDGKFVFCCFNKSYKISPQTFGCLIRILECVDGSVLWLTGSNSTTVRNLRSEAAARGVNPDRIVFAQRMQLVADHLARHSLADLFLDTLPYTAHTTASDALWAGLPVLTCAGNTFPGRVAASLLRAAGLPELVTDSLAGYRTLALKLARSPDALAAVRAKLATARVASALFDTKRFTRHLEAAYFTMWQRYQEGLPPAPFAVEPVAQP